MNIEQVKPRKIFHYDSLTDQSHTSEEQYFLQNWQVIQSAVGQYLIGQGPPSSIVKMSRALQILLTRHKYKQLHEHLIRLFYEVYKSLLVTIASQSNCLLSLLAYYTGKKQHYRILFDLLNAYLQVYSSNSPTLEQQAYAILCKQIFNSHLFEQIANELMVMVHRFRTTQQPNEIIELQYQLRVVTLLGIYNYCDLEFIERSKVYFIELAQQIQRNEYIFTVIDEALRRETALNKLLKPTESSVRYLQKELIEEYYPFMIEYMDYLITQSKLDKLKMLWKYSLSLGQAERQLLELRLQDIIRDAANYIKQTGQELYNLLPFINKLNNIITTCFDSSKSVLNLLHHTIQQLLTDHQKSYNAVVSQKILCPTEGYSQEVIYQLFRLIPNKERFIAELQIRFFRWILNHEVQTILYQQQVIHIIKKECGNALCKRIDRMMGDVWKDGQMVYYRHSTHPFKCRLLCSNEWPKFSYQNIALPDSMLNTLQEFELQFKKSPENSYKELKWVNEFGVVEISINGIISVFSECQAALVLVLDRAIRPMKKQQLIEVLQGSSTMIGSAIDDLHSHGVFQLNEMNMTYDINNDNTQSYRVVKEQKQNVEEIKTLSKRDDTIIVEAAVVRILKKKRTLQKTDLSKSIYEYITTFKPTLEQINQALERLAIRDFIDLDKTKGNIRYKD